MLGDVLELQVLSPTYNFSPIKSYVVRYRYVWFFNRSKFVVEILFFTTGNHALNFVFLGAVRAPNKRRKNSDDIKKTVGRVVRNGR